LLLVEDDDRISHPLRRLLENEGFEVHHVDRGSLAISAAATLRPDLVLLDLGLPDMDGLDVCRELRARGDVPIIVISARADEVDKVVALEIGADDYVSKPFSPRELTARVKSVLRRARGQLESPAGGPGGVLRSGDLTVDMPAREARVADRLIPLTVREFDLLAFLMSHPRRVFRREELLDRVWGYTVGDTSTVTVHVRRLREKVERDPASPERIQTVWGVGYRFQA
jgi:DNA-binding response OmpR family regulator